MRKFTVLYIILLLIIVLPSQILMIRSKALYPSHDGLTHIQRIEEFHANIIRGQIPPRITYYLNEGIGYPMFVANYQLPYYFAEILMNINYDPVFAFKSVLSISYILSVVFIFFVFKEFWSNLASLVGSVVFAYLPYRFADLYTRGAFGESVALMFLPLALLSVNKISRDHKKGVFLFAFSIFGLITSHTIIFLLFLPFMILYLFILRLSKELIYKVIIGLIFGVALSSYQILPIIFERKYLRLEETFLQVYKHHFINIYQLLRIPTRGVNIGTTFQIGIVSLMIIILSLIFFIFNKSRYVLVFLSIILLSLFLITSVSLWLWTNLFFLKYVIFPWRLLSIIVLCISFLAAYLIDNFKFKKTAACIIIILVIYTSRHYFLRPTQFSSTPLSAVPTFPNEFDTIWTNDKTFKVRPLITTKSDTNIQNVISNGTNLSFSLQTTKETDVIIRKIYFPGWTVKLNGTDNKINQKDGLIYFQTTSGNLLVELHFKETFIRKTGNLITLFVFIGLIFITFPPNFIKRLYGNNNI